MPNLDFRKMAGWRNMERIVSKSEWQLRCSPSRAKLLERQISIEIWPFPGPAKNGLALPKLFPTSFNVVSSQGLLTV